MFNGSDCREGGEWDSEKLWNDMRVAQYRLWRLFYPVPQKNFHSSTRENRLEWKLRNKCVSMREEYSKSHILLIYEMYHTLRFVYTQGC